MPCFASSADDKRWGNKPMAGTHGAFDGRGFFTLVGSSESQEFY